VGPRLGGGEGVLVAEEIEEVDFAAGIAVGVAGAVAEAGDPAFFVASGVAAAADDDCAIGGDAGCRSEFPAGQVEPVVVDQHLVEKTGAAPRVPDESAPSGGIQPADDDTAVCGEVSGA